MIEKEINVLIVEDQKVFAQGLQAMLLNHERILEVDYALDYESCFEQLKWKKHTIVILDINFDQNYSGVDIAKKIKELYPNLKILILTQIVKLEHYKPLMEEIQVDAYLDKKLGLDEIYDAIDTVCRDETYLDKRIESMLQIKKWMLLSEMEKDIIEHLGKGLSYEQIGEKIFRSTKTVEYHIGKLKIKTNSNNSVEIVQKYNTYKSANREPDSWK